MLDLELESQVLAAMIENKDCLDEGMIIVKKEFFYDSFYKAVFENLKSMYQENKHIDIITVHNQLGDLAKGHGISWMALKDALFSKKTFGYCVEKLNNLYLSRRLYELSQETISSIENGGEIKNIMANNEAKLYALSMQNDNAINIISPTQQAEQMLDTIMSRMEQKSNGGIKTSYGKLNLALNGGFLPGQLVILAAQTGKGKSAFAMNLMRDIAIIQKIPALYINTEMSKEQMDCRWATILTFDEKITHSKVAGGQLNDAEIQTVIQAMDKMHNSGFYSVNIPDLNINNLISTSRRFKAKVDAKVIVVDYVGRMDTTDSKLQEWQVFRQIAKRLKTLAQELQLTVIMLAQITEGEKLEGAKSMKNECDLYGYLRESTESELSDNGRKFNYRLVLDKNRDGQRLKIPLEFIGEKLTFRQEI